MMLTNCPRYSCVPTTLSKPTSTKVQKTHLPQKLRTAQAYFSDSEPTPRLRPVVILPGLGNNSGDYLDLSSKLLNAGLSTEIAQVSRPDWLRNAAGLLDGNYWKGTLQPRPVLDWYLERIQLAIASAKGKAEDGTKVSIVAHSAGGWLARLYLSEFGTDDVEVLLTLGTPHSPPPRGVPGVVDQTRGLLYYIEENCPGAYHNNVKYICVAGRYLKGLPLFGMPDDLDGDDRDGSLLATTVGVAAPLLNESGATLQTPSPLQARIVGQGYKQVCGKATVWGDGVVPEVSAHLDGAINITLGNVYHSPVGANDLRPWYGSPGVLEQWIPHLLD